ncbi:hypothetical protein BT93_B1387 [Corymbia citriodora subsp. variegata]|nr:hypothetical protein BT93_B1387 [Corymbia citriodora subsp. variegata]
MIHQGKVRIFSLLILSHYAMKFCIGGDVITASEYIRDSGSIISSGGLYRLGFFSPNGTTNRYVGIWHNKIPAYNVFWVANREKPVLDSSGVMTISDDGNLVIMNGKKDVLWSSNVYTSGANTKAQLSDTGNLILFKQSSNMTDDKEMVWESFRNMSDAFMAKMKLSTNVRTKEKQVLTSWKSPSDPSIGSFSISLEPLNIPEIFLWNSTTLYWRSGPWNGKVFIGVPQMESVYLDGFSLVDDKEGYVYVTYNFAEVSYLSYFFVRSNGELLQPFWDEKYKHWRIDWSTKESACNVYGKCGPFGFCDDKKSPICSCLRGFEPKKVEEWRRGNWSSGCTQRSLLQCDRIKNDSTKAGKMDGFVRLENVKVPNYAIWSSTLEDQCREQCLSNCSCAAYAYDAGVGCMYWRGDLIDVLKFSYGGTTLYVRVAHTELGGKRDLRAIIATAVVVATFLFSIGTFFAWKKSKKQGGKDREQFSEVSSENVLGENLSKVNLQDLVLYKLEELAAATSNFSDTNKLGEGGFGAVYRGILLNGKEIAVKRLSRASGQGLQEFINEMVVISKVQHRNLVRLFGCCVERDEKLLVYEFMPNKGLDAFLFDSLKRQQLDWRRRFNIIDGICRGLLYLHRDSRLRIIHRDLKTSNILLDEELNPRISDFGTARIFGGKEDQANTIRVVGTYGYMAPEYAMEGRFSEKSDVFSFGVLLLEIVSGRQNNSFIEEDQSLSLLGLAWKYWEEDNVLALVDPQISVRSFEVEIVRCINVALLCTQELAQDRPTISTVISMINNEIVCLPSPNKPAFTERQTTTDTGSSRQSQKKYSANNVTLTALEGR